MGNIDADWTAKLLINLGEAPGGFILLLLYLAEGERIVGSGLGRAEPDGGGRPEPHGGGGGRHSGSEVRREGRVRRVAEPPGWLCAGEVGGGGGLCGGGGWCGGDLSLVLVSVGLVSGQRVLQVWRGGWSSRHLGDALLHLPVVHLVVEVAVWSPGGVSDVVIFQDVVVIHRRVGELEVLGGGFVGPKGQLEHLDVVVNLVDGLMVSAGGRVVVDGGEAVGRRGVWRRRL